MIDGYSRFLEMLATVDDDALAERAIEKLIVHLRSAGRIGLLPKLLRELKRTEARRETLAASVEVAHAKDADAALKEAAALGIVAKSAKVNHTLVTGWRARANGVLIDHSGKQALIDIYQHVTV